MTIEEIRSEIEELSVIINQWESGVAPVLIEQDIVLQKIAKLYEGIKFISVADKIELSTEEEIVIAPAEDQVPIVEQPIVEPPKYIDNNSIFAIDLEEVSLMKQEEVELTHDEEEVIISEDAPVENLEIDIEEEVDFEEEESEEEFENELSDDEPEAESVEELSEELEEPQSETTENEVEQQQIAEEDVKSNESGDNVLFDIDVIPKQTRSRRSILMSLYDDDSPSVAVKESVERQNKVTQQESIFEEPIVVAEEPKEELKEEESTVEEPKEEKEEQVEESVKELEKASPQVFDDRLDFGDQEPLPVGLFDAPVPTLADSFVSEVETVADRLAGVAPRLICDDRVVCCSFDELGINERYLLARDLFGDDPQRCREVLAEIEAFDNYDDAMIYIAENFDWSSESDGAKLLLSVLECKFNS